MTAAPSSKTYMKKGEAALAEAQLLLGSGHTDGACSRAYYAMFDAAHVALFALGAEGLTAPIETHGSLIGQFGRHVVLAGHLPAAHGEALNRVQRFRKIAEYSGDPVSPADAQWAVEQAAASVAAIRARFVQ